MQRFATTAVTTARAARTTTIRQPTLIAFIAQHRHNQTRSASLLSRAAAAITGHFRPHPRQVTFDVHTIYGPPLSYASKTTGRACCYFNPGETTLWKIKLHPNLSKEEYERISQWVAAFLWRGTPKDWNKAAADEADESNAAVDMKESSDVRSANGMAEEEEVLFVQLLTMDYGNGRRMASVSVVAIDHHYAVESLRGRVELGIVSVHRNTTSYTDLDSLANLLGQVGLELSRYHEISFNFPATELLPPGVNPHLRIPRDLSYREKPDADAYLPDPDDLDFFHRLPVSETAAPGGVPRDRSPGCLISSIERLATKKGVTTFDIVRYYEERIIVHHIRLTTTWRTAGGDVKERKDFILDEDEFAGNCVLTKDEPWMRLLQHLLERASARAYFQVLDRLLKYDTTFPDQEEMHWRDSWAPPDQYIPTAKETFCNHFVRQGLDADGKELKHRINSLDDLREHALVSVRLPGCGHKVQVEVAALWHVTEEEVLVLACDYPGCASMFFPEHKQKLIELGFEKRRRQQFLAEQKWWALFDFSTEDRNAMVEIGNVEILQALSIALPSMRAPETVLPGVMGLVDSIEIRAAVKGFEKWIGGAAGLKRTMTLKGAHERLIKISEVSIRAMVNGSAGQWQGEVGASTGAADLTSQHDHHLAAATSSEAQALQQHEVVAPRFERFVRKWTWRAVLFTVTSTELAKRQEAAKDMAGLMKEMGSISLS